VYLKALMKGEAERVLDSVLKRMNFLLRAMMGYALKAEERGEFFGCHLKPYRETPSVKEFEEQ